jgi:hypothetical protein
LQEYKKTRKYFRQKARRTQCSYYKLAFVLHISIAVYFNFQLDPMNRTELDKICNSYADVYDIRNVITPRFSPSRPSGSRIGADPSLTGALTWVEWVEDFSNKEGKNLQLVPIVKNPIDQIWYDKPKRSKAELEIHELQYAGN